MDKLNYNPDVLTCLANLSNDEVFTPPDLVNDILDLLPKELFESKDTTFLDPVCKTGVFLREIAKRLMNGLIDEIPDKQDRINHIFANQLFGIAITEITSLLARRSVYCSKKANGNYSVCKDFTTEQGNIIYERINHKWGNEKCVFCGANKKKYNRSKDLETYAYQFIHTKKPEEIIKVKFDVIVGNPPYQLGDTGFGASASPIYHKFIQQSKKLNPRFLTMIVPSRWFAGGRGLDAFRKEMLQDDRIREIHDFIDARDCFPGTPPKGGVNYFLWDRDNRGLCKIYTHDGDNVSSVSERRLLEEGLDTFVRVNEAVPILRKVLKLKEDGFNKIVSANDPFGFDVRVENSMKRVRPKYKPQYFNNSVLFYYYGWKKKGVGYIDEKYVKKNHNLVDSYKLFVPKAIGTGDMKTDVIKPFIPEYKSCSSETYIVIGPFDTESEMENSLSYINTKFFHFMVGLKKNTQEARRNVYSFAPMQDFSQSWTDEKLYKKYGLDKKEIAFIESMVRPVEFDNE